MTQSSRLDFNPYNLPREALAAIGLAAACSSQTETIVEMGIAGCAGVDVEYGAAITTHMSAPLRDHVLRALAEIKLDDLDALDELDAILDHINKEVWPKRNAIVHDNWCTDEDTGQLTRARTTARGSVDAESIPVTIDEIEADALVIYEAGMKLLTFLGKHNLIASFPAQPRPRAHKTKAARKKRRKKT